MHCLVRAVLYLHVEPSLQEVATTTDRFVDFTCLAFWSYLLDSLTGVTAFLSWVRIFKYVSFNKVCVYNYVFPIR